MENKNKLKNVKVFSKEETILGVPKSLFTNITVFTIAISVILKSFLVGIFLFLLMMIPMNYIHKSDPKAFAVWLRAIQQRGDRWAAGYSKDIKLIILKR